MFTYSKDSALATSSSRKIDAICCWVLANSIRTPSRVPGFLSSNLTNKRRCTRRICFDLASSRDYKQNRNKLSLNKPMSKI